MRQRRGQRRRRGPCGGGMVSWSAPLVPGGTDIAFRVHAEPSRICEFEAEGRIEAEEKGRLPGQPKLDGTGKPQVSPERLAGVHDLGLLHVDGDPPGHFYGLREVRDDGTHLKIHGVDKGAAGQRVERAISEALRGRRPGVRREVEHVREAALDGLLPYDADHEAADELRKPTTAHERIAVSYTHLRAHETDSYLVCRLLLEKKKKT